MTCIEIIYKTKQQHVFPQITNQVAAFKNTHQILHVFSPIHPILKGPPRTWLKSQHWGYICLKRQRLNSVLYIPISCLQV